MRDGESHGTAAMPTIPACLWPFNTSKLTMVVWRSPTQNQHHTVHNGRLAWANNLSKVKQSSIIIWVSHVESRRGIEYGGEGGGRDGFS